MEELKELLQFLKSDSRLDLKAVALMQVLGLTGTEDGRRLIISCPDIISLIVLLCRDSSESVAKDSCLSLVNISADESSVPVLLAALENHASENSEGERQEIIKIMLNIIVNPSLGFADSACMVLSNMTRPTAYCVQVLERIEESGITLDTLVRVFCQMGYNKKGANLNYLGPVFSNLSQLSTMRRYLLDRERCVIQRLLPFTEYKDSLIRRGGIVGTLRNCCFDKDDHKWLLSEEVDILPRLLLPLAGPEEFDEEDNDKLPLDLQYLPPDKLREPDPDIRAMLLEAITKLCTVRENRVKIRECNTYVILRELHKWEKDRKALLACENLVDILIRTEEEIGEDEIDRVEVPSELIEKFEKMDEDYLKS
ncbi:protein HGH1 homolog [Ischnura elegans]|uniref:protein HGH1 homolog n=1 Tax=Ischnura elegans TaxID=197161 RepID=UPI001ED8B861|nr:protein HGH1 homolog [Ischnura elegans]